MRKSCEWKGQLISTQSLLYIMNAYWQNLKTSVLCFRMPFSWISTECNEQVNNVETNSWKISLRKGGSLLYIALSGSQHPMSFCEKKTKKPNYNASIFQIFENLEDSCGPRISLSWMCTFQPFYVRLTQCTGKQRADVLKDNVYGGIGFSKEEAKTSGQLLLHLFCTEKNE